MNWESNIWEKYALLQQINFWEKHEKKNESLKSAQLNHIKIT